MAIKKIIPLFFVCVFMVASLACADSIDLDANNDGILDDQFLPPGLRNLTVPTKITDLSDCPAAFSGSELYLLRVNSDASGVEVVPSFSADIGNLTPNTAVYADLNGKLQSHPIVSSTELNTLDGARSNLQQQIDDIEVPAGTGAAAAISVGPEAAGTITATVTVSPQGNYRVMTWLSESDGGAPTTTPFDGVGGAPWTNADSTVFNPITMAVRYDLLTGPDGDLQVAFSDSGVLTKYLCADVTGNVICAPIAFTGASVCTVDENLSQTAANDTGFAILSTGNLAQKISGATIPPGNWEVCEVRLMIRKADGAPSAGHIEWWSEGANDAGKVKGATTQIGVDSATVTISDTNTLERVFTWSSNPPIITGGVNYFLHWAFETTPNVNTYVQGNWNETLYEGTAFDVWQNGADQSADLWFAISLKAAP